MEDKSKHFKTLFLLYFDGGYGLESRKNTPNTYEMGVGKLEYNEDENKLTVHLRRPGLLIGRMGRTIDKLKEWIGCDVEIKEIKLCEEHNE